MIFSAKIINKCHSANILTVFITDIFHSSPLLFQMLLVLFHNACFLNTEKRSFYSKTRSFYSKHRVTESQSFFLNTKEQRDNVLSAVEDTEAAKAAFTKSTKISIPAMLCFHPVGFVATFKSLVIFVSRKKNFVPLFLCV